MGVPVPANTGKLRMSVWMPCPSLTGHTQHVLRGPKNYSKALVGTQLGGWLLSQKHRIDGQDLQLL